MVVLRFHGELRQLLTKDHRRGEIARAYRGASVKDVIEACGVPHPEVGVIVAAGREVDFAHCPGPDELVEIFPPVPPLDVTKPSRLRPEPLAGLGFVVDVNAAKLGRWLRMLGFDVLMPENHDDAFLAEAAVGRVLLTRDRRLLKRGRVVFGHLVRADDPVEQVREVVTLYGLRGRQQPFSRCMRCNDRLRPVAREEVLSRLEPLTKKYYTRFKYCARCDKVYWAGSHREKMERLVRALLHPRSDN